MQLEEAFENFRAGFESGRIAQGYTVVGPARGAAQAFAEQALQLLFCRAKDAPCESCRECAQVAAHTLPDVLWVEPQKRSRIISIEQVRELQHRVLQTPFSGDRKACVLVAADRLGPEAANAFLKTLEEPPGNCTFFLLTEAPQFLLSTIASRCQRITVSTEEAGLEDEWQEALYDILLSRASGSASAAFGWADRLVALLKAMKGRAEEEENSIAEQEAVDEVGSTLDARINARYREMRSRLMRAMLLWYRDVLLTRCGAGGDVLHHARHAEAIGLEAGSLSVAQALRNVGLMTDMNRQLEQNLPEEAVLSLGATRLG